MVRRLFEGAEVVDLPSPGQVTVTSASKSLTVTAAEIHRLLLTDGLAWRGRVGPPDDFRNLLVDREEIRSILRPGQRRESGRMALGEAAATLMLSEKAVCRLAKEEAGAFMRVRGRCPFTARMVVTLDRERVAAFSRRYVSLGELRRRSGIHHGPLGRRLAQAGVPTRANASICTMFYERRAAERCIGLGDVG